jgi:nucleotide-binding universal stress UspA family protein
MQRIVVAAKAGAEEAFLADAARQLAQETGAQQVTVVSVDGVEMEALAPLPRAEYTEQARHSAEVIAERLREQGIETQVQVRSGRPVRELLKAADELDADMIVVGTSSRGPVASRLLGDVSLELAQRAGRPVLIVGRPGR